MTEKQALAPQVSSLVLRLPVEELPAHLAQLEAELSSGCTIELLRGDAVIAELRAKQPQDTVPQTRPLAPDFMARMKARWGDRIFNDSTQWVREDRDAQS